MFLATWKDIPNENESQFQVKDCHLNSGEKKGQRTVSAPAKHVVTVQPYPVVLNARTAVQSSSHLKFRCSLMMQIVFDGNSSAAVHIYM